MLKADCGQGHRMLTQKGLEQWPTCEWMQGSKRPGVHTWLSKTQGPEYCGRLKTIGNVVVPQMAFCAANLFHGMLQ